MTASFCDNGAGSPAAQSSSLHAGDLVLSVSIEGLLNRRDSILALLRQAVLALKSAGEVAAAGDLFSKDYRQFGWVIDGPHRHRENSLLTEDAFLDVVRRLDAACWHKLMHESGLLSFMDSTAKREFLEKIEKCETPALTVENIEATFRALYAGRDDMFDRGVIRCFQQLSWCYKSNNPVKFGKRIIKRFLWQTHGSFNYSVLNELDDLQRVFRIVDGKPEEDHRAGLSSRIRAQAANRGPTAHTDTYLSLKWFKNGNGHITFLRPDLIDKLNAIIAKHYPGALPPPAL